MMKSATQEVAMGKRIWISAAAVLGCGAALLSMPASAHNSVGVQIGVPAPVYVAPPPVYYYTPPPQPVWVPGHWEWQGNRHVWVHGQYIHHGGYHGGYHGGGRWVHRGGDRDRDGIPDRYDRDLDNDGVRNRHDRDRDGDGVPNWHDRSPNNRYRR
jgi:hypothetical protein